MRYLLGLSLVLGACGSVSVNDNTDRDLDNDGVLDVNDLCPSVPEPLTGDGDGCPDPDQYATVGVTWSLKTVNGALTTCPPGFDSIALFNVAVDGNGNPVAPCTGPGSVSNTCFVDLFNCESMGSAVSAPIPPAQYQTWISVTDSTGSNTYAQSLSAYLDVRDVDLNFNASIFTDGGFFSLDWTLEGSVSNNSLTCTQAGATAVETVVTVAGGSTLVDSGNGWPCSDYYGVTAALPVGTYTVSVDALTTAGSLGASAPLTSKMIQNANRVTDLGSVVILIDNM